MTAAHIRQPTLLFRAAASFTAFRCRHPPCLSGYSPAHGRIPEHAAGCGLSSKTDRKKRASLITYPHSVMKHFQNDRTRYSFYGFLNYFRQPRPNCDTFDSTRKFKTLPLRQEKCRSNRLRSLVCDERERNESVAGILASCIPLVARGTHGSPD